MWPTWPGRRHSNDVENPDDPTRLNPDAVNMQPIRKMLPCFYLYMFTCTCK